MYTLEPKKSKVPVVYGRNSVSDLASRNDVATNGVNGRIVNKTWCKCEWCAPMETSTEGVCCLEITGICKRRLSSRFASCLNVCRSDSHFVLWYSRRENFLSYLISIQCWSSANQDKSFLSLQTSWLMVFCKPFYLINHIFFFIRDVFFVSAFFQKSIWLDSVGLLLLKNNILLSD